MTKKEYNGWFNYETWLVNLWFDNDGMSEYWRECAESLLKHSDRDDAILALSDEMKEHVEDGNPCKDQASFYADLMNAAISEVNFWDIAEHYFDDLD